MGNVRGEIFKNKRLSNAEIDQIRLEINVSTADEPEEKLNDFAIRNTEAFLAVDQPMYSNEIEALSNDPCNSESDNQESDMKELFIDQNRAEVKHARKDILNEFRNTIHLQITDRASLPKVPCSLNLFTALKFTTWH